METALEKINRMLGINESYKAPGRIMEILSNKDNVKKVFSEFLKEFEYDLSYEWFRQYFEEEHADRKGNKQDFTPDGVTKMLTRLAGDAPQYGIIHDAAAGTGGIVIAHWYKETRKHLVPWSYRPSNYLYFCEELSDRAIPFLLFNLMIRGMNAVVIHGDTLTRETKEVYYCENKNDCYISFSELRKLQHTEDVEKMLNVKFLHVVKEK